jgi:dihydrolipoamide dehydrogenase
MENKKKFDVIVLGGGPAGYVAAIRCAQLGLSTACVDKWLDNKNKPVLGGTCLNVGCIPSKALLDSSHHFEFINKESKSHGIEASVSLNVRQMLDRKNKIVAGLTQGISSLFKKNKVEWLKGSGKLVGKNEVEITHHDSSTSTAFGKQLIIATGSNPVSIKAAKTDNKSIVDSSGALSFTEVPESLCIIGAGVIGLELGSVWRRLGSKVTMLEAASEFLPTTDAAISKEAYKIFCKQGLDIQLNSKVTGTNYSEGKVEVHYESKGGQQSKAYTKVIVAVGRTPNTANLGLESAGVKTDERGFVVVDDDCNTGVTNIYAVGDCVRGPMLAHKASEEGVAVAERILGQSPHVNFNTVPWVIYTWPEIAWVGKSEQQLINTNHKIRVGTFPFLASGRAHAMGSTQGFVKVIADELTDEVLGVHIIGPNASELISEAVLAMEFGASSEDIARTIHGHPTLSEALHEAALAVESRTIHY